MNAPPDPPHDRPAMAHGLAAALVRRPVTLFMLFLTLLGTGVMAYTRIPLTFLPEGIAGDSLTVILPFPGAAPAEVEDQLAIPVEDALQTIPGIKGITAFSNEGSAAVQVEFSSDTDMDVAYGEVRDRIERIRNALPPEMDRYRIRRFNQSDLPIVWIGVQYDEDAEDPYGPIERIAVPRLDGVDGVASVNLNGVVDEAVRVFVDFEKVKGYGIDLGAVIQRLQADNFAKPAGDIDEGDRRFAVRIDARYESLEEIRRYPVGNGLVLEDIADIVEARAYRDSVWRIGGRPAVGLSVGKESGANTVATAQRVEDVIASFSEDPRLDGMTFNIFWSQKDEIDRAVTSLRESAIWGGLFAVLVLLAFLRDLRMTLLAALAIPGALLAALAAVYFSGSTLNMVSLTGFTIGIGMLVDNAVVIIESISRRHARGDDRLEASARGTSEVGTAVLTATLTSVVVFLPLAFMDGGRNTRIFLREMGLPISYSLLASLLVALVFLPAFTARVLRRSPRKPLTDEADDAQPRGLYARVLGGVLTHRLTATLVLLGVVALSTEVSKHIPRSASGNDEGWRIRVGVDIPSTYTLTDANGVFSRLEQWAEEQADELQFDTYSVNFTRRGGDLSLYLDENLDPEVRRVLPHRVRAGLPRLPGVETTVGFEMDSTSRDLVLNLEGPDFQVVADTADAVVDVLEELRVEGEDGELQPLFETVKTDLDQGLQEVQVSVDRERAAELGVDAGGLQAMISWGLGGQRLPDVQFGERELQMLIEYGRSEEESLEFLRTLGVPTDTGTMVPLATVATLGFDRTLSTLIRRDGRTSLGIRATPSVDSVFTVARAVDQALEQFPLPEGYAWRQEGGEQEVQEDLAELFTTLAMSVALVYLLMAILLESVILPLATLVSIGLAMVGVNFSLAAFQQSMNVMVAIGMILLAGIVVNNAIVLLDRVQRLRLAGVSRRDALLRGGADRVRPILMTALTTICGLLPMAAPDLFPGSGSRDYQGMAIAVAGGLAFSTLLTLLVVPLFYTFFDDLAGVFARLSPFSARRRAQRAAGGEAPGSGSAEPGGAEPVPSAPHEAH